MPTISKLIGVPDGLFSNFDGSKTPLATAITVTPPGIPPILST